MPHYIVSYDLRNARDYEPLYAYLRSRIYAVRPLESVWLIETKLTASELRDEMKKRMDKDDGVLVVSTKLPAAWSNVDVASAKLQGHFE